MNVICITQIITGKDDRQFMDHRMEVYLVYLKVISLDKSLFVCAIFSIKSKRGAGGLSENLDIYSSREGTSF